MLTVSVLLSLFFRFCYGYWVDALVVLSWSGLADVVFFFLPRFSGGVCRPAKHDFYWC
ncbi:transmembrane protein, putative [Medicago truncatula]|uniref:Transmembrane protein, putative n=1 Tax=Medicago truncatula TaxID=3880 RepID=G7KDD9_MEDTR|nr:transmembrane protein, putative [Medicago truncatula]